METEKPNSEKLTDAVMMQEIRKSLSILDSDEALQLLPPLLLDELYKAVVSSSRLIQNVRQMKEVEKPTSNSH